MRQVAERKFNYAHDRAVAAIFERANPQELSLWEHLLELRESVRHELGMARCAPARIPTLSPVNTRAWAFRRSDC